jgi:ATP-dependent RNA helicase RhlE
MTAFSDLNLVGPLMRALEKQGYETPTPIQASAIPHLLDGRDLMGIAQTGGGKTAAFVLPLLQSLQHDRVRPQPNSPSAVILAPTRELAGQIGKAIQGFSNGMKLFHTVVYGGAPYGPQLQQLKRGVDILVATPGRLMDHMDRGTVKLGNVQTFILDEADRMLDMGFIEDVQKISADLPEKHQTVMFSATMSSAIKRLSSQLLDDPEYVEAPRETVVASTIDHSVCMVGREHKKDLLMHLLAQEDKKKVIVFVRTKMTTESIAKDIEDQIEGAKASAIHGDRPQRARERTLRSFTQGRFDILVATDVAARGIDVSGITHVINYDLPMEAENYVHRVGRTGRAGASGVAISICEPRERNLLRNVENVIKTQVRVDMDHPFPAPEPKKGAKGKKKPFGKGKPTFGRNKSRSDDRPYAKRDGQSSDRPHWKKDGRSDEHAPWKKEGRSDDRSFAKRDGQSSDRPHWKKEGQSSDRPHWKKDGPSNDRSFAKREGQSSDRPHWKKEGQSSDRPHWKKEGPSNDRSFAKREGQSSDRPHWKKEGPSNDRSFAKREGQSSDRPHWKKEGQSSDRPHWKKEGQSSDRPHWKKDGPSGDRKFADSDKAYRNRDGQSDGRTYTKRDGSSSDKPSWKKDENSGERNFGKRDTYSDKSGNAPLKLKKKKTVNKSKGKPLSQRPKYQKAS